MFVQRQDKTTDHVDDGGGHSLKVHGALALLPDVGVGPHHGLVGVVEAEGHGVATHVQPLQGLHLGLVRGGGQPLHSHLQHGHINTLKPDPFLSKYEIQKIETQMQERYWVLYRRNSRCCGEEIQISAVAAERCQGLGSGFARWENIDTWGQLCSLPPPCVPHTSHTKVIPHMPSIPYSHQHSDLLFPMTRSKTPL